LPRAPRLGAPVNHEEAELMGIIDFVKGGVRELMIARPDGMKHLIVFKHPDGNIPNYARLTVDMDEVAVFFKSGSPPTVGALGPGRYPLSTENIPFLNHFVTSFTGGNIFQAEVFFVKNQPVRNLTFGGQMMSMRDPELDLRVTPRAYGTYSLIVVDPIRFIIGYSGQAGQGDNEAVTTWLRQRLFQGLGKTLGGFLKSGQTTFMDLGGVAPDLASAMLRDCPDFSEIGVRILEIGELKISVSPEDQARIDELQDQLAQAKLKARVAKVGISQAEAEAQQKQLALDQQFQNESRYAGLAGGYQGYAAGRAMIGAGEGMARGGDSSLAGAGAQMAIGVGMAGWMQQGAAGRAAIPQPVMPAAAPGTKLTCPKCSAQVPSGKFCQECGGALAVAPAKRFCTGCGAELGAAKFCANCGTQTTSP
jgi:membrane protease subunit (stomatin/prohibitin family)